MEPTPVTPVTRPIEEYARDRLKDLIGKELSRGARVATATVLGFALAHAIPLNAADHAYIAGGIQAVSIALPVIAGMLLRRLGAYAVEHNPKSQPLAWFQKAVSWLPL